MKLRVFPRAVVGLSLDRDRFRHYRGWLRVARRIDHD